MGVCFTKETEEIHEKGTPRTPSYQDDRPYEERTKEEIMQSEANQFIRNMNRKSHGF